MRWKNQQKGKNESKGISIAAVGLCSAIGGVIGFYFGGPAGAKIGAGLSGSICGLS